MWNNIPDPIVLHQRLFGTQLKSNKTQLLTYSLVNHSDYLTKIYNFFELITSHPLRICNGQQWWVKAWIIDPQISCRSPGSKTPRLIGLIKLIPWPLKTWIRRNSWNGSVALLRCSALLVIISSCLVNYLFLLSWFWMISLYCTLICINYGF